MWPWMWFFSYAPTYRWPAGGDWTQTVQTDTTASLASGNPSLERLIQEHVASYGRQLGWLNEVLLAQQPDASEQDRQRGAEALGKLRNANQVIQVLKAQAEPPQGAAADGPARRTGR